jgi:XTP/dITP diphosphohydrolase
MTASALLATGNQGKIRELSLILKPLGLRLLTLADLGQKTPEPEETGESFLANALIKARHYAKASGLVALADDSGLTVAALGGAPGVRSARYGGQLSDQARNLFLLSEMAGATDRRARFKAVLALARPDGRSLDWAGELAGEIALAPLGSGGFGYDPIFLAPSSGLTLAQMPLERKNKISHRARAGEALARDLAKVAAFIKAA